MKIGQKVTVLNRDICPFDAPAMLRCYITRIKNNFIQAYDPIRDYSWGWDISQKPVKIERVMSM